MKWFLFRTSDRVWLVQDTSEIQAKIRFQLRNPEVDMADVTYGVINPVPGGQCFEIFAFMPAE